MGSGSTSTLEGDQMDVRAREMNGAVNRLKRAQDS